MTRWSLVALFLVPGALARGEEPPPSLRTLALRAPVIVFAVPTDPIAPRTFKVKEVLRGDLRPGDVLAPAGLTDEAVRTFDDPDRAENKPRPRRVAQALLFLERPDKLLRGGLRFCTDDGRVLAFAHPGGELSVREAGNWSVLVTNVREDVATLAQLRAWRRLARPERRVASLLGWLHRQRGALTLSSEAGTDEAPVGWDDLPIRVFDWVFESATPERVWPAVRLYAELHSGETPRLQTPLFATPEGRAALVRIALDKQALSADRSRALTLLAERSSLWPDEGERKRGFRSLVPEEQDKLLDELVTLLPLPDKVYGPALIGAIVAASLPADKAHAARRTTRPAAALIKAYNNSPFGVGKGELALAAGAMATPTQWKDFSQNPFGVVAVLRDFAREKDDLVFWLDLRTAGKLVHERPEVVVEKLNAVGFPTDTKRAPLNALNPPDSWAIGWDGTEGLAARMPWALQGGFNYRVRVEGFVGQGKERAKWHSEVRLFREIVRPKKPRDPRYPGPDW